MGKIHTEIHYDTPTMDGQESYVIFKASGPRMELKKIITALEIIMESTESDMGQFFNDIMKRTYNQF